MEKCVDDGGAEEVWRKRVVGREDGEGHDGCEIGGKGLGKVDEARVDEQDAVPGLVRDPGQLVAREARIERVRDRAHSGDGVPEREMMIAIARERRHAVARDDALRGERSEEHTSELQSLMRRTSAVIYLK